MNPDTPQQALVLGADTPERFAAAVAQAAARLAAGELVALPTETVYGLAANALNAQAVARIYAAKGRPAHNPIIVHVEGIDMARRCVAHWPAAAERLAAAFWPGPLTLVLPRAAVIPDIVTAGGPTVGVRWPRHPFIRAVIGACGFPLAAPSANPSNRLSPTTARHVAEHLGNRLSLIVDGGTAEVGIESTVVDLSHGIPKVLRPGMISEAEIAACVGRGDDAVVASPGPGPLRSPGLLKQHYAPRSRLCVCHWSNEAELAARVERLGVARAATRVIAYRSVPTSAGWLAVYRLPAQPKGYAGALYATLHRADVPGTDLIVVEEPPAEPAWAGVNDRLRRAAAGSSPTGTASPGKGG